MQVDISQMLHVWKIYLHLAQMYDKTRLRPLPGRYVRGPYVTLTQTMHYLRGNPYNFTVDFSIKFDFPRICLI